MPKKLPMLLAGALVLCATALLLNYFQPHTTYAVTPSQPQTNDTALAEAQAAAAKKAEKLAATPTIWPVSGPVTSGFGDRTSPFGESSETHAGIDIAIDSGVPVVATADGRVLQSGPVGGYGNLVQLDHGNGVSTLYGHNSQIIVQVGDTVKKGQIIAYAGSTGRSTGPHVHYEVRENDTAVNPWKYLIVNTQHA